MHNEQLFINGNEELDRFDGPFRALAEFYAAFNTRNLEAMSRNWADTDDVVMANPVGGVMRGWEQIRSVYERIFSGRARVRVEFYDYTVHRAGDLFYAVGRERVRRKLRPGNWTFRFGQHGCSASWVVAGGRSTTTDHSTTLSSSRNTSRSSKPDAAQHDEGVGWLAFPACARPSTAIFR